ncbi:hypothetical protein QCA50_019150 [Cerrena zonata]|uniref:F-box domain-containing protein n=1 Tax=Cerrena zonata TaxID=2478898 RepID=A0AAW0FJQ9_9APHY
MPSRPLENTQNKDKHRAKTHHSHKHSNQHGRHRTKQPISQLSGESLLFSIPSESLTHITAFLAPPSLLALAQVNKRLHDHVADDNTWRRAYVYQFLGILPEDDLQHGNGHPGNPSGRDMMLRRTEASWKREFVFRWNLRRRWERSRSTTVTHVPVHSTVSNIHLMPVPNAAGELAYAVLSSSLAYGVVARSLPLRGYVFRGYLDASGTLNGLGVGNPNAEFSPDLTKCAMASEGGIAKVLWGFRTGAVAVTNAAKAADRTRQVSARWTRCQVTDAHDGAVEDAIWAGAAHAVTGGADGRVKIWDVRRMTCVWTSQLKRDQLIKDPCAKVAADLVHGIVVGLMKSGEIAVWSGFSDISATSPWDSPSITAEEIRVPPAARSVGPTPDREIQALHIHAVSSEQVSVLALYEGETVFHRVSVDLRDGSHERSTFGESGAGIITALQPVFSTNEREKSFIISGDQSGNVNIFPWDISASTITPTIKFEVFNNSAVAALAWSVTVLVVGSSKGIIKAFDSLSFEHLRDLSERSGASAVMDPVGHVIVQGEMLVASIGSRVLGWLAGPIGREKSSHKAKTAKSTKSQVLAKWQQQMEMFRDINESRQELEREQAHTRRAFGREREQHSTLSHLGLSEVEAVEYVLMLSRDEEESRRRSQEPELPVDEGVFFDDFDDVHTPLPTENRLFEVGSSRVVSSHHSVSRTNGHSTPGAGRSTPNGHLSVQSSPLNHKIHVSPRLRPEPMEAGTSISPGNSVSRSYSSGSSNRDGSGSGSSSVPYPNEFPSMSSTPTHRSLSAAGSVSSAWNSPLRSLDFTPSSPTSASAGRSVASSPIGQVGQSFASLSVDGCLQGIGSEITTSGSNGDTRSLTRSEIEEREAEDLRFAIELSLAEARSRGDDV